MSARTLAPLLREASDRTAPWFAPLIILALVALAAGLPLVLCCTLDGQIDYNEGWNAYRQEVAMHWYPLYAGSTDLAITNYPPLSFHLIGLLAGLCGDVVLAGRLVSVVDRDHRLRAEPHWRTPFRITGYRRLLRVVLGHRAGGLDAGPDRR